MYKYDAIKLNQNSLEESIKMLNDYQDWELVTVDNGVAYFKRLVYPTAKEYQDTISRTVLKALKDV